MASTAFAGTWQTGAGENQGKLWYDNEDGSYASNGWHWIDGNVDGIAESYYFDNNGWLLTNTTTPDGYTVNADGAWIENGTIQTQTTESEILPISENDFIISRENSVTRNNSDNNIISNWVRTRYWNDPFPYHVFVYGDSLITSREISLGSSKNDVIAKYGNTSVQDNILIGVIFFRDSSIADNSVPTLEEGYYQYYNTDIFDEKSQTLLSHGSVYDGTAQSYDNIMMNERSSYGLAADFITDIKIGHATNNSFIAYYDESPENAQYYNEATTWCVTYNKIGNQWFPIGGEAEPDFYWIVKDSKTFELHDTYHRTKDGEPTGEIFTEIRTFRKIQ